MKPAVLLLGAALTACAASPKPSILLVTIDTLRADHVGCYGDRDAATPNLDALAGTGLRFDDARSHVPLTAPSHATILTGVLPPRHGVRGNGAFRLKPEVQPLAEVLRSAGYRTGAVVASVVLDRSTGLERGFEIYDDNQRRGPRAAFAYLERGASQVEEAAAAVIGRLDPPFFVWVHFYDPHVPWIAPGGQTYDDEIAFVDRALGGVLRTARARAGKDLVIAVVADHGESLGEHGENQHGYTLHRGVLRVPLILAGPRIPAGRVAHPTIGLADLAPTLAELAHVPLSGTDGASLSRLFVNDAPSDAALWEESLHPLFDSGWAPLRGLTDPRWHFVLAPRPELYDRASDPDDRTDVSAAHPGVVTELRARLLTLGEGMHDVDEPEAGAEDTERRERLASLGYLSAPRAPAGPSGRLDPKDGLPGFLAIEKAERFIEADDGASAASLVEPFLRSDPGNPRLWHTLGKARALTGDLDGADAAIRHALALAPGLEFLRYTQADICRRRGDEACVADVLTAIVLDNPRAVEAVVELSVMAMRRRDREQALAILERAYEAGARDPELLDRLGQHMLVTGREAEAARYFDEALALWPDDPAALLALGQAALRAQDPATAIDRLARCAGTSTLFDCRIELARAYVVGPRDLDAARRVLVEARSLAREPRLVAEVDRRLAALASMSR